MRRVLLLVGLVGIMLLGGWAYSSWSSYRTNLRITHLSTDTDDLFEALQMYKERVGSYPVGSNAEVVKALMGNNAKNLTIVVGHKKNLNTKGELVDPWGTPFRIYFAGEGIMIRSAGPNKRFDDSTVQNSDDWYRSN